MVEDITYGNVTVDGKTLKYSYDTNAATELAKIHNIDVEAEVRRACEYEIQKELAREFASE